MAAVVNTGIGDNPHPGAIGSKAMADAIDLAALRGTTHLGAVKPVKITKKSASIIDMS